MKSFCEIKSVGGALINKIDAPFKFLIRPVATTNVTSRALATMFEEEMCTSIQDIGLLSPITGILILPVIMDNSIAPSPPDYVGHQKKDNSISVGISIDFTLWENSSELERLDLLADNVRCSLDKIQCGFLANEDREKLQSIVNKVKCSLASRLLQ